MLGLCAQEKHIDPRFFYDDRGSELFELICGLPEYYLTRAESEILEHRSPELASMLGERCRLVELGSGSSTKTKIILEAINKIQGGVTYCPIDVSDVIESSSHVLLESYSWLNIVGVKDTYENGLRLVHRSNDTPALIAFLGSSLGNMDAAQARVFLRTIGASMHAHDMLLVGLDLHKDEEILKRAYDDSMGITAEFNFNLLRRVNSELSGNIDVSKFEHHVKYNMQEHRIETYLRSKEAHCASVCGKRISFGDGELVLTEYSHKYTESGIRSMMRGAGLEIRRMWYDSAHRYALVVCSCASWHTETRQTSTVRRA